MACPSIRKLREQTRAAELDPWFTVHLLVCEECRDEFNSASMVRRSYLEGEGDRREWEKLDEVPAAWLRWMLAVLPYRPDDIQ